MMHFRHMMFVGLASLIGVFAMFLADTSVFAQIPPGTMSGFAWSDASDQADQNNFPGGGAYGRGGGWISFDSDDFATLTPPWTPPSQTWSVTVNPNTGVMSGYAYSSFLGTTYSGGMNPIAMGNASGYIRFTDIGEVPPSGPTAQMARLDIQNGRLEGWARACAVFQSGCSGALLDPLARGGWDGWISLGGIAQNGQPYGVNMTSYDPITGVAVLDGYAWGDINLGWIFFDNVTVQLNPNPPVYCTNAPNGPHYFIPSGWTIDPNDPTLCIPDSVNPSPNPRLSINAGCYIVNSPVSVQWATSAVEPLACTIDSSPDVNSLYLDNFPATSATTTGSVMSGNLTTDTTFLLSCQSLDVPSVTHTAQTVSLACPANVAVVSLSNSCTTTSETTVYWSVDQATSCTTNIPGVNISLNNGSDSGSESNVPVGQSYTISCVGQDGNTVNRTINPVTSSQCSPTGGGVPRPGFQEI